MSNVIFFPNLKAANSRANATGTVVTDASTVNHSCLDVFARNDSSNPLYTSAADVGKAARAKARIDYSSTNVTTAAYVELISTVGASNVSEVEIFDSSGQTLILATGAAASESDKIYIIPGGNGRIPLAIASGTRVSVKAVSATANAGELTVNFYG